MKLFLFLCASIALIPPPGRAQLLELSREEMIKYTPENPFERFEDGRPKAPDGLVERLKALSVEDAWNVLRANDYNSQYAGDFEVLHPGRKLVGRAFTVLYLPYRPDVSKIIVDDAVTDGPAPGNTQRVVDHLQLGDVAVVSLMGAAEGNNFGGDNMHAALYGVTKAGAVVDGTIRDLEGTFALPTQIFYRKPHPAAVDDVTAVAMNVPIEIGGAMVMPGDIILGDRTGVIFIPPHLLQEVVEKGEATQLKDDWRKEKFLTGEYKASDLYGATASEEATREMEEYVRQKLEERKQN